MVMAGGYGLCLTEFNTILIYLTTYPILVAFITLTEQLDY